MNDSHSRAAETQGNPGDIVVCLFPGTIGACKPRAHDEHPSMPWPYWVILVTTFALLMAVAAASFG
jgi:hypothetical protein